MDRFSTQCVVIGGGVIGLAIARSLALKGREVIVLEAENAIGQHASSRNSEVIHAGLYYPPGSLKAKLCVKGKHRLYAYCEAHKVAHRRCGKLIVADSAEEDDALDRIWSRAIANRVNDLKHLSKGEARKLEPSLSCYSALLSPSTGIIDSHGLMLAYQGEAEDHGAAIALGAPVETVEVVKGGFEVKVGGEHPALVEAAIVVNAAGFSAPALASRIKGLKRQHVPQGYLCKGNYYALQTRAPFSHLIYPVPEQAGLGVHLTLDLGGQGRFGPDTEWIDTVDYEVDPARADKFYAAIRRYWPALPDQSLVPAYAGVRAKIAGPGEEAADFVIEGEAVHGLHGLVNLFGIESPGLTSSLPIADEVMQALGL